VASRDVQSSSAQETSHTEQKAASKVGTASTKALSTEDLMLKAAAKAREDIVAARKRVWLA
jgi:hypothetical protein